MRLSHEYQGLRPYMNADTGTEAGSGDPAPAAPDLTNPAFQKIVEQEVAKAVAAARKEAETSVTALEAKTRELLDEKKKLADKAKEAQDKLEELTLKGQAEAIGADSKEVRELAQKYADAMFATKAGELDLVVKKLETDYREAAALAEQRGQERWRTVCERELYAAVGPGGVAPAGFRYIVDALVGGVMVEEKIDGKPPRFVIMHEGAKMPGADPGTLMNLKGAVESARLGQGPLADYNMFLPSAGQGSGTTPLTTPNAPTNWHQMSPKDQDAFVSTHTPAEVRDLIDRSPLKKAA